MRHEFGFLIFVSSLFAVSAPIVTSFPYFGDKNSSPIQAVALDPAGNIYIAGTTSGDIPLEGRADREETDTHLFGSPG